MTKQQGPGTIIYTPGYAPPEQILGYAEQRSDLFALAATMFHLVTGKRPNGTKTAAEITEMLDNSTNPIHDEYRWFFELLRINLSEDPNDRYYSAAEFKADLERQSITKKVSCLHCHAVNPVRVPYCVACAKPMTPARDCQDCGKENRLGNRWCIHCGNRLK